MIYNLQSTMLISEKAKPITEIHIIYNATNDITKLKFCFHFANLKILKINDIYIKFLILVQDQ